MAVKNFISSYGQIQGEMDGGVMRSYGTDALGSVVATYKSGAKENTYRYKPYGAQLAKTGTAIDPVFLWNGSQGYRSSSAIPSVCYVQHRHYGLSTTLWLSQDVYWPKEMAYTYCLCQPTNLVDPSGWGAGTGAGGSSGSKCVDPTEPDCCKKLDYGKSHCKGDWCTCKKSKDQLLSQCTTYINGGHVDCDKAWGLYADIAVGCASFGGGGTYKDTDPWAMSTNCCNNPIAVSLTGTTPPSPNWIGCTRCCSTAHADSSSGVENCFYACEMSHEEWHRFDCVRTSGNWDNKETETCGYYIQAKCMYDMFAKACGWPGTDKPPMNVCVAVASSYDCVKKK